MRIVLIGKKRIIKDALPKNFIDSYWIKDETMERNIINIKNNNGKYEIISNDYFKIININNLQTQKENLTLAQITESIIPKVVLQENDMYMILLNDTKEIYILCCLPDYESDFTHVDIIGTNEITIGSDSGNHIMYKNPFISGLHAKITKFNGKWTIENYDSLYGIFVNDFPVYSNKKNIFNGDIVFIMGLEIIIIKDSLYINNPQNNVVLDNNCFIKSKIENTEIKNKEKIQINDKQNIKYHSKSPRMIPPIKKEKIEIDPPPEIVDEQQKPMLLVLGSSIAMGIMMLASLTTTIQGLATGTATILETIIGFVTAIAMLIAMLVIPILDVRWDKKSSKKYEEKRQKRYKQYLDKKNETIDEIKNKQKEILYKNYLSSAECAKVIALNEHRLWERKISDEDFLSIRIGLGKVPLKIDISYPQEKFAMVDDNLVTALGEIANNSKMIDEAPVTVSLCKNSISAIISEEEKFTIKYMKNMLLQLVTLHSYTDLKLVFLLNSTTSKDWQYVKMLPHVWDDAKQIRFFADNYDDMNEISKYLVEQLNARTENENKDKDYKSLLPYYLIITDNYKQIENLSFMTDFFKMKENKGFSLLCITDDIYSLPSGCKTFIDVRNKKSGVLWQNGVDTVEETEIHIEQLITIFFEKVVAKIANIPVRIKSGTMALPNNYTFLEMYNVGNIEQLDILGRWKKNDSTLSLKAPIGVNNNGMIISLDAHEKFHGPHGLIAGSTGSGKSEFIITYILSLAVNYHPHDVTFLLIDYKGGGLAGAFQKNNIQLPHLVGTITNIDKHGLERSLTSIQSELKRRQIIFNEARNITNEGTIDIYKYQKLYHDGVVKEPISHLFIICDEFAELKQQQPDFMDELVSVSRIGRSLGVHLILATQKPSGIVDDQIRSNSKFGICLKVQDTSDSQDVILRPDAAYLKNPGQFYLKVGQNEYFILGQSGWAGAPYIASEEPIKKLDSSVEFISNIGLPIKKVEDTTQQKYDNKGEQLTNLLQYICDLADSENIKNKNLWLENIPSNIFIKNIRHKYNVKNKKNTVKAIIGEYDDPSNQKQGLVEVDFSKGDNIIVYGNAKSGKETLLSTMIYDLMVNYTTLQIQMYILDFGTEALKIFKKSPYVGDILFMGQDEKIETFFEMIQKNIKERKQILSDYNGDYNLYISKGNNMPIIVIIVNNYEVFNENYEDKYDDMFLTLTREGVKCGIVFVVTASSTNAMRYRLTSNFNKKIALQLNDESDYYSIFDAARNKRPTQLFGRGLVSINNQIYEFQTAKICDDAEYNEHIEEIIKKLDSENEIKAIPVPTLPKKIEAQDMKEYLKDISKVPIGLVKKNLEVYMYDFTKKFMTVISTKNMIDAVEWLNCLLEEVKELKNTKVKVLDADKISDSKKEAYDNFVKEVNKDMKDKKTFNLYVIVRIDKFANEGAIDESEFSELLEKAKQSEKQSFIIIDNPELLEGHGYDEWYVNFIDKDSGIWIGNGMENQTLISLNLFTEKVDNNCGNSFGYVVDEGNPTLIKLIGIEEEGDENE